MNTENAMSLFELIFGSIVVISSFCITTWSLTKERTERWAKIIIAGGWAGVFVLIIILLTQFQLKEIEVTIPAHKDAAISVLGKLPAQEEIFIPERRVKRYVFIRKHHKEETIENNKVKIRIDKSIPAKGFDPTLPKWVFFILNFKDWNFGLI